MSVYVNRILNLKKIKAIGFDMDYTLVRYNTEEFERLTHQKSLAKLIELKNYPKEIGLLSFEFNRVIQGLVIDKKKGHLLKVSRFGKVKHAVFGEEPLAYKEQDRIYRNRVIDLNDTNIQSLDTSFSISNGVLFGQLVELKKKGLALPDFETIATDIREAIDLCHADGTLKDIVRDDVKRFIVQDADIVRVLERLKDYDKKLLVITNSDWSYCKLLLDYAINPFLKEHKDWSELFDITITLASKPRFFTGRQAFLAIDPATGLMSNTFGKIENGIYQGGWAGKLQDDLGFDGDEILYLGDHIYGDVVSIKKTFNWRTALVLEPLEEEVAAVKASLPVQSRIDELMIKKEALETKLNNMDLKRKEEKQEVDRKDINKLFAEIEKINEEISSLLEDYRKFFNPNWGELMRAGQEESRMADQVEKYACIYMAKVSDLLAHSPKTYFRPAKRVLPHELVE
ncbi:MAG: 5'-nucleotidase [Halobacteriovorax sp.]|nr:5'-nucleotidase [Halobacteriovorax sp.]